MKSGISVIEASEIIMEIQGQLGKLFKMIKVDMSKAIGNYLSEIMEVEFTRFLGRQPYERSEENEPNHATDFIPAIMPSGVLKI